MDHADYSLRERFGAMQIALTGATGFLGSALASQFLKAGCSVLALVRSDANGFRTRKAIASACLGLGGDPAAIDWSRLVVRELHIDANGCNLDPEEIAGVTCVWHAAAEMSYNAAQLAASFGQNVGATLALYQLFAAHAPLCERFYYVSTAYTAGFDTVDVGEDLHLAPRVINVYQASKWAAELSLSTAQRTSRLPLTIFRPSIIVGDEKSGWYGVKEFGMYSICRGLYELAARGAKEITMEIGDQSTLNMIPINRVVAYALALTRHPRAEVPLEILHATAADAFPLGAALTLAGRILKVSIQAGQAISSLDRVFARSVRDNHQFAQGRWRFATTQLAIAIGPDFQPYRLDVRTLERLIVSFLATLPSPEVLQAKAQQSQVPKPLSLWTRLSIISWRHLLQRGKNH